MTTTEQAERELDMVRGHSDPPAIYYWNIASKVALEWMRTEPSSVPIAILRMHLVVLGVLEAEAHRENQMMTRGEAWAQASFSALIGYGDSERDTVLTVLHSWAKAEDEDRWAAALPPCDQPCTFDEAEFSQSSHLPSCSRGAAWRLRYKLGAK